MGLSGIKVRNVQNEEQELFKLTEEIQQAMDEARKNISSASTSIDYNNIEKYSQNFRDYDQSQMFFLTVSKEGFIVDNHVYIHAGLPQG